MSDSSAFQEIKENIQKDPVQMCWRDHMVRNSVKSDIAANSPDLAHDARNVALFDLAFADLQADWKDGGTSRILYDDAMEMMKTAKKAGASMGDLDAIAQQVGRRIPQPPKL